MQVKQTKNEMKTHEIFEACIPLIESKQEDFICHAIFRIDGVPWNGGYLSKNLSDAAAVCLVIIENRLGPDHSTLENWLYWKGYKPYDNPNKVRDTRIAWLKSLVQEFKE